MKEYKMINKLLSAKKTKKEDFINNLKLKDKLKLQNEIQEITPILIDTVKQIGKMLKTLSDQIIEGYEKAWDCLTEEEKQVLIKEFINIEKEEEKKEEK